MQATETAQQEVNTEATQTEAVTENKTQVEQPAQPEKKEMLSSQFAALAKKEKIALQRQREAEIKLKDAEEKLKLYQSYEEKKKNAKLDPFSYLADAGLSYDELTEIIIKGGGKPIQKDKTTELEEKINSFISKKEQEEKERAEKEQQALKEQEEKIIAQFKESVNKFIKDNAEKYELINLYEASDLVIATIEQHFESKGEILSNDMASELVEKHLEEEVKKLSNSKKFSSKFKEDAVDDKPSQGKTSTTLASSVPSSSIPSSLPPKTEEDRLKRALAALG